MFKGARAQKIGLKTIYLKYDLGKSLSKKMWCKMVDTKKIDYIILFFPNDKVLKIFVFPEWWSISIHVF